MIRSRGLLNKVPGVFVDSHCHLNYLDNPEDKIVAARESGVEAILCIGVEQDRIAEVVGLATRFPRVWCSVGINLYQLLNHRTGSALIMLSINSPLFPRFNISKEGLKP